MAHLAARTGFRLAVEMDKYVLCCEPIRYGQNVVADQVGHHTVGMPLGVAQRQSGHGTHVLATGGSAEAATATGISTGRVKIAVYTIAGLLAGVGAILLIARVGAAEPASNTSFLLNSVAAVVLGGVSLLGGRATILGPVIGALLLTALTNGLTLLGVSQFYQPLAVGVVVVLAALLTRFQK